MLKTIYQRINPRFRLFDRIALDVGGGVYLH
jgi:hypothetical protein